METVAFAAVQDKVSESIEVAMGTQQWYFDQGKVSFDGEKYHCNCLVCRQHHKNVDPTVLIEQVEWCRQMHVHDKGVTF